LMYAASPLYVAVTEWSPPVSVLSTQEAVPPLRMIAGHMLEPSEKETVPVAEGSLTVAVNVADCPYTVGLEELIEVVVMMIGAA